jgi:LysM domain
MRIDRSMTTARSDGTDGFAAAQASFDRHLQAARDGGGVRDSGAANDNTNAVTVKRGDTLWDIAEQHGISMRDLYRANRQFNPHRQDGVLEFDHGRHGGWDPDYIRPGDRIKLPSHSHPQPRPPSSHPRRPPAEVGAPGGPDTRTPTPNAPQTPNPSNPSVGTSPPSTPNGPDASGTPNVPTTPDTPAGPNTVTPSPNAPNAPNPSNPSNPSATPNTPPTPNNSGHQPGLTPIVPIAPHSQVLKGGVGIEAAAKASAKPTVGGEPYVKGSLALGQQWNINAKIKYTPRGKLFDAGRKGTSDPSAPPSKPSLRDRIKAALPEKVTVDAGLVFNKRVEGGGSLEIKFDRGVKFTRSAYVSQKDPTNVLVDNAQLKLGKLSPAKVGTALVNGTRDSLAQSRTDAKANGGRWSPLRQQVWKAINGGEITIAGEKAYINSQGPLSGFANYAGKTTFGDVGQGLEHPAAAPSLTRFTGFAAGTAASFLGAGVTDELIGQQIGNQELRRAVDGFGGAMTGLVIDPVAQKTLPAVASEVAPTLSRLAAPVVSKAAPLLADAAPVLSRAGEIASKIPLGATGRVLSKVARIGGPAGALVAGIPDGIDAFKAFQNGDTADGWKAVGRGAVRVAGTAVGAVVGQALIPIPGVGAAVGAVAGGFVGDLVAKLF